MFQMPNAVTISARSSSLTNSFVNSIIPVFQPSEDEIVEALSILGMTPETVSCAYCGATATEWDHLRPLVKAKRPTGYVSEIANLVPACGKCNQSKGGSDWREWMTGPAKLSPRTRGVPDLDLRIERLDAYSKWREPMCVDFEELVGSDLWSQHWDNHRRLLEMVTDCQQTADVIRSLVRQTHGTLPVRTTTMAPDSSARAVAPASPEAWSRLLQSVGRRVFVDYFDVFADDLLSTDQAIDRLPHDYSEVGRRTRVNCARRIIRGGMAVQALASIAESSSDADLAQRAAQVAARSESS